MEVHVLDRSGATGSDHEVLKRQPASARHHASPDGCVAHRQDAARSFQCAGDRGVGIREPLALVEPAGALDPDREVLVTEVEPHVDRQPLETLHHAERVIGEAPAALVDPIREPERDQVGVGRHVRAVDLDVIAGVRDHDQRVAADDIEHSARELCSAGTSGEHDDGTAHGVVRLWDADVAGALNVSPGRLS